MFFGLTAGNIIVLLSLIKRKNDDCKRESREKAMGWRFLGSTTRELFFIDGIDIFKEKWITTGTNVEVIDPQYGDLKSFTVWKIRVDDKDIIFVAGEFSNGVWGIYSKR
jgi:hypothetical protein